MNDAEQRRHEPTARRRRQARQRGDVAHSRELSAAVVVLAGVGLVAALGGPLVSALLNFTRHQLSHAGQASHDLVAGRLLLEIAWPAALLLLGVLVCALLAGGGQVGWPLAPRLRVDWSRLSPARNWRQWPLAQSGWSGLLLTVRTSAALLAAGWTLWDQLPLIANLPALPPAQLAATLAAVAGRCGWRVGAVLLLLGGGDYLWQRWLHSRRLRMTDQELRDERRQQEAAPEVASRRRAAASSWLRGGGAE